MSTRVESLLRLADHSDFRRLDPVFLFLTLVLRLRLREAVLVRIFARKAPVPGLPCPRRQCPVCPIGRGFQSEANREPLPARQHLDQA